jgi:hypothetical protein
MSVLLLGSMKIAIKLRIAHISSFAKMVDVKCSKARMNPVLKNLNVVEDQLATLLIQSPL